MYIVPFRVTSPFLFRDKLAFVIVLVGKKGRGYASPKLMQKIRLFIWNYLY